MIAQENPQSNDPPRTSIFIKPPGNVSGPYKDKMHVSVKLWSENNFFKQIHRVMSHRPPACFDIPDITICRHLEPPDVYITLT